MFECLSILARYPNRGTAPESRFRKLATDRGSYFIDWRPEAIKSLLASEGLSAEDFRDARPEELHRLTRELLLLGLQDEMQSGAPSPIARFARSLMGRKERRDRLPSTA